ncbi:MAG: hypothetical protein ISS49_00495 [Anaerolineae bacterium]|nr:hypothetical protein [Anaerolineae bacterium]
MPLEEAEADELSEVGAPGLVAPEGFGEAKRALGDTAVLAGNGQHSALACSDT